MNYRSAEWIVELNELSLVNFLNKWCLFHTSGHIAQRLKPLNCQCKHNNTFSLKRYLTFLFNETIVKFCKTIAISELTQASLSNLGLVHNHSYENKFNLQVNEFSFSYERMGTKTRFEKEAKGHSEMAYWTTRPRFLRKIVNSAAPRWLSARRKLGLVV